MKKIIFLLISLLPLVLTAQQVRVKNAENNLPLDLVTLVSNDCGSSAVTDVRGEAEISRFKGCEEITISRLGYRTLNLSYADLEQMSFDVLLEKAVMTLDMVVVSSNRWQQKSDHIPYKVDMITPDDIQFQNPQTAADLLGLSGDVFIQKSQQGGGSPMIRGFATNRLLYTVDGVRMNTAIFRSGNLQNVISLDPFAMENVEVLFGPASVSYGSDAIGGVMAFQTKKPLLDPQKPISGNADVRYSSANKEKTGHIDLSYGGKKWAGVTSFSYNDYDDLKMGEHGPDEYIRPTYVERVDGEDKVVENEDSLVQTPSGYSQFNIMQKLRFQPNENWDINYGFHYSETSEYGRYDRCIQKKSGTLKYGEWKYGPQIWMMNNFSFEHTSSNALYDKMSVRLAQQHFEESRIKRNINKVERNTQEEKVDAYSINLDFNKKWNNHQFFYGAEVVYDDVNSKANDKNIETGETAEAGSRYPQANWGSYAVYVSDQYALNEKVDLSAGLRYNYYVVNADFDTTFYPFSFTDAKNNNGALTGSIGGAYRPNDTWLLRLNLSTAFRAPNVDDIGKVFDSGDGIVVVPNPDLEPEYSYTAELGVAKIIADIVKLEGSFYYTYLNNAMVRRNYTMNGQDSMMYDGDKCRVQAIQNVGYAYVYGTQLGVECKLPAGFTAMAQYNYQKGEEKIAELGDDTDDEMTPMRHVAPSFVRAALNYEYKKLKAQLVFNYNSEVSYKDLSYTEKDKAYIYAIDDEGNPYCPSWYTIDLDVAYHLSPMISFNAGVHNITDQRYRPYSSGICAAGRNFIFATHISF